jgi:hypothetical protein
MGSHYLALISFAIHNISQPMGESQFFYSCCPQFLTTSEIAAIDAEAIISNTLKAFNSGVTPPLRNEEKMAIGNVVEPTPAVK